MAAIEESTANAKDDLDNIKGKLLISDVEQENEPGEFTIRLKFEDLSHNTNKSWLELKKVLENDGKPSSKEIN